MRQFDVCRLKGRTEQIVVVLQHDLVDDLETRVVAPLSDKSYKKLIANLRLPVDFEGRRLVLQIDRMAAIDRREIGNVVGRIDAEEQRIKSALDLVFLGV